MKKVNRKILSLSFLTLISVFSITMSSYASTTEVDSLAQSNNSAEKWIIQYIDKIATNANLKVSNPNEAFSRNDAAIMLTIIQKKIYDNKLSLTESDKAELEILEQELNQELNKLKNSVDNSEKKVAFLQGAVSELNSSCKNSVTTDFGSNHVIKVIMQDRFDFDFKRNNSSAATNFSLPYVGLRFSGKASDYNNRLTGKKSNINYLIGISPSRTFNSTAKGMIDDATLSTNIYPGQDLMIGQSRVPIGYEGALGITVLDTINRSQISRNFANYRDLGIKMNGTFKYLDYSLGAFNGNKDNTNDNYDSKLGFASWLVLKPFANYKKLGDLRVGGGNYNGKYSYVSNSVLKNEIDTNINSLYGEYIKNRFSVRGEYETKKGYSNVVARKADGFYVQSGFYLMPQKLQVLGRYDIFDPDKSQTKDKSTEYTLGLNYYMHKNNIRLQLNAVHVDNQTLNDSNKIMIMTQFMN